jgi:phage-related tail fiber protein
MVKNELGELKDEVERLKKTVTELGKETACIGAILPYGGELVSEEEQKKGVKVPKQQELLEEQGWLFCDGRAVNREYYRRLYEVIGANFGALDKDHFNLPDLRGRFVRGVDHGAGRDPAAKDRTADKSGGNANEKVGSVQEDCLEDHKHNVQPKTYAFLLAGQGVRIFGGGLNGAVAQSVLSEEIDKPAKSGKETRPKNIYVNWIIYAGKKG